MTSGAPPRGPWSDLPPKPRPARQPVWRKPRAPCEPLISNWRGLLIILFLLIVAPILAGWVSRIIMQMISGG